MSIKFKGIGFLVMVCIAMACSRPKYYQDGVYSIQTQDSAYWHFRFLPGDTLRYGGAMFGMNYKLVYYKLRLNKGSYFRGECLMMGDTLKVTNKRKMALKKGRTLLYRKQHLYFLYKDSEYKLDFIQLDTATISCPIIIYPKDYVR